jgi:hypothetical protein
MRSDRWRRKRLFSLFGKKQKAPTLTVVPVLRGNGNRVTYRSTEDKDIRREAILPLHHVFAAGPVARGECIQMTGLGERTGRKVLSRLIHTGLLASDSHVGPVRIGLPLDALSFLFPELYPEAATKPE